ncbi:MULTISPECIES: CopG family ribbon-helix-helix protein [Natrialbaceae]|uniref:CopG family ribbon-helix-helix protein n=1 Tax=Natrialbaceae TaxID=1644061 RepID=UPI0031F2F201
MRPSLASRCRRNYSSDSAPTRRPRVYGPQRSRPRERRIAAPGFEDDRLKDAYLAGTVSVLYDFGTPCIERRVTELRHEFDAAVAANDHSHVDDYCLDLFVLEAELEEISSFVGKLWAVGGVESVDYSLVSLDAVGQLPENRSGVRSVSSRSSSR